MTSASPSDPPPGRDDGATRGMLLVDHFLPRYDYAVVHAQVFHATPAACLEAARGVDLFGAPLVRALLDLRALPERLAGTLTRSADPQRPDACPGWMT